MSRITIAHPISEDTAHQDKLLELLDALERKYGIHYHTDDGRIFSIEGNGISGTVNVADGTLHIDARLGFLMMAFKPVIENEIHNQLNEHF